MAVPAPIQIDGGAERDRVSYEDAEGEGVRFYWQNGKLVGYGGEAEGDTLANIEYLVGSKFNDVLEGNSLEASTLEGLSGDDTLRGGKGGDYLLGGAGGDTLDGREGEDGTSYLSSFGGVKIDLQAGTFSGGDADGDLLISVEQVQGSAYDDVIYGNSADNRIDGFIGDDVLGGGAGKDTVDGGHGNDVVFAFGDGDKLSGGGTINEPGIDLLSYIARTSSGVTVNLRTGAAPDAIESTPQPGYSTFENLEGTKESDSLTGDLQYNRIRGLSGDDSLNGDDGNDTLDGGLGADKLSGGAGLDLADYSELFAGVTVNLFTGTGKGGAAEGDTLGSIENLRGSELTDKLTGNNANNVIDAGLQRGWQGQGRQGRRPARHRHAGRELRRRRYRPRPRRRLHLGVLHRRRLLTKRQGRVHAARQRGVQRNRTPQGHGHVPGRRHLWRRRRRRDQRRQRQ